MTDRMNVDLDAMPDKTALGDDRQRTVRSLNAAVIIQEDNLMGLPLPERQGFDNNTYEDQSGCSPEEPPEKKQKMSMQAPNFIGLSSASRGSHREPVENLLMHPQDSVPTVDALEKTIEALQKEKRKADRKINHLEIANGSLKLDNMQWSQYCKSIEKDHEMLATIYRDLEQELETEKTDHRKEVTELEAQVNDLTRTKDRLRQMIVPVSEKQVIDSDVVSKFTSLRISILALVRQTWKMALKETIDIRQLSGHQGDFFRSRLPLSFDRVRSVVFQTIHGMILGRRNYFLQDSFQQLEQHIQTVERGLRKDLAPQNRGRVLEWRTATFKATENLRDNGRRLSLNAQDQIWHLLSPLQTKNPAAEQNGREKLRKICDDAVEFSLMIRQLKDHFWVHGMGIAVGGPISNWERAAEEIQTVAAGDGQQPGTIAYVIAGGLIKNPKEDLKKALWLEKAEVAVYE